MTRMMLVLVAPSSEQKRTVIDLPVRDGYAVIVVCKVLVYLPSMNLRMVFVKVLTLVHSPILPDLRGKPRGMSPFDSRRGWEVTYDRVSACDRMTAPTWSAGEYARDEDGDGFYEVHVNTLKGTWSLLCFWLRLHRRVS